MNYFAFAGRSDLNYKAQSMAEFVAAHYGFTLHQLTIPCRKMDRVYAREISWYLLRQLTDLSFPKIAKYYHRDHSTILDGVKRITSEMQVNNELSESVKALKEQILYLDPRKP